MDRYIVTASEHHQLRALVADPSRPEITDEVAAHHEFIIGPRLNGRRRGWRAASVGVQPEAVGLPGAVDMAAPPALARLEWGRWLADCPDCPGAGLLLRGAPFLCGSCFNGAIGYRYRRVDWPSAVRELEAVLLERPTPDTRTWDRPGGETLADLADENTRHGIRVPASVTLAIAPDVVREGRA